MTKTVEERDRAVVRFAGDSGDGMQLTGNRLTSATAVLGNDLATLPDFPAEIRAPAGTVHGVSAFQIQFAATDVTTPGDHADVLVAMNPAALKADLGKVTKGGTIVLNEDAMTQRNLEKAGYAVDPTSDGSLDGYQVFKVPMTSITVRAVEDLAKRLKEADGMARRGLACWRCLCSSSRSAIIPISRWAKSRAVWRISSCSGLREKEGPEVEPPSEAMGSSRKLE